MVWIPETLSKEGMRSLIESCDCFVLPTRGEGWGLPIVEAMAMEKAVIATNHSGPSAFLTRDNSYPLRSVRVVTNRIGQTAVHTTNSQCVRI